MVRQKKILQNYIYLVRKILYLPENDILHNHKNINIQES